MNRVFCLLLLLMLASTAAFADIARPEKTTKSGKAIDTTMTIRLERDAKEARLLIPASKIKQLRAELEQLDDESDDLAAATPGSFGRTQTIVSGMFLSLALVFGGFWFARSEKAATRTGKGLVVLAITLGAASAATLVYANVGPPPEARSINGNMFSQAVHMYGTGWGNIKLEASKTDHIELIVPNPKHTPAETGSAPAAQ